MRLAISAYNPAKECCGCLLRDEKTIAAHILSYQLAARLLARYSGSWQIQRGEIVLHLTGADHPLVFDVKHGNVHYGTVSAQFANRYDAKKGLAALTEEICEDLRLPATAAPGGEVDKTFNLLVKLVEIFHARCGLEILPLEGEPRGWELRLHHDGPSGYLYEDWTIENRYGETFDLRKWNGLRLEKMATYLFGFNRFCGNFPSPCAEDR